MRHSSTHKLPKVIVIVGATASGKTSVSLRLAKEFRGEITSADSRQIYKYMDIGTAKEPGEWRRNGLRKTFFVEDIPHHMIDFLDPGKTFTAAQFRDKALKYVKLAEKHGNTPMIVGGTGLYVSAIVDNYQIPRVTANKKMRDSFEEKSNEELTQILASMDPIAVKTIDTQNKRRLIRALEVCILTGQPFSAQQQKGHQLVDALVIGMDIPRETLYKRIDARVDRMFAQGLEAEVRALRKRKYAWKLPSMSGVGYRQFKPYLNGERTLEECKEAIKRDTRRYAKRQATWFRRDKKILWLSEYDDIRDAVATFLSA